MKKMMIFILLLSSFLFSNDKEFGLTVSAGYPVLLGSSIYKDSNYNGKVDASISLNKKIYFVAFSIGINYKNVKYVAEDETMYFVEYEEDGSWYWDNYYILEKIQIHHFTPQIGIKVPIHIIADFFVYNQLGYAFYLYESNLLDAIGHETDELEKHGLVYKIGVEPQTSLWGFVPYVDYSIHSRSFSEINYHYSGLHWTFITFGLNYQIPLSRK